MPNQQQPQWKVPQAATPPAIHSPTLTRVVGLIRGLTGVAGVVTLSVLAAELTVPPSYKPSVLIGSFHGNVDGTADAVRMGPATALTRKNAEAAAEPQAFAGMETEAFRQQQQALVDSMQTQSTIANTADGACVVGRMIPRDNRDWGWLGEMLSQGCGVGNQVRQDMMKTLRQGGQDNSVLIQRPRADGKAVR